jgi:Tfx family DNA-binding protein
MAEDTDDIVSQAGFDPETSVLTRRQAEVLALRERGLTQQAIADRLDTSRANVSGVEASARANVERARETVAFAEALEAPVRITVPADIDLYDVPARVYDACDEAGVKVNYTAPELMQLIGDRTESAVRGRQIRRAILVGVTREGEVRVRQSEDHGEL